jgi:hypothetical protein
MAQYGAGMGVGGVCVALCAEVFVRHCVRACVCVRVCDCCDCGLGSSEAATW